MCCTSASAEDLPFKATSEGLAVIVPFRRYPSAGVPVVEKLIGTLFAESTLTVTRTFRIFMLSSELSISTSLSPYKTISAYVTMVLLAFEMSTFATAL